VYVPESNEVAGAIVGFWLMDENAFGPLHKYVAPAEGVAVKFNALPSHNGELELTDDEGYSDTKMVILAVCVHPLIEEFPT